MPLAAAFPQWAKCVLVLTCSLFSPTLLVAADPPRSMFRAPEGWMATSRSETGLFFDAPDRAEGAVCRISIIAPAETPGSFRDWFELVQAPDPVVEESKVEAGKSKGVYEMLRQSRVVKKSSGNLHRMYVGLRDGKRFTLILYTASSEELYKANLKAVDALVESWDFAGQFPDPKGAEKK